MWLKCAARQAQGHWETEKEPTAGGGQVQVSSAQASGPNHSLSDGWGHSTSQSSSVPAADRSPKVRRMDDGRSRGLALDFPRALPPLTTSILHRLGLHIDRNALGLSNTFSNFKNLVSSETRNFETLLFLPTAPVSLRPSLRQTLALSHYDSRPRAFLVARRSTSR